MLLPTGPSNPTLHRCASPACPGLPYKASEQRHPCAPGGVGPFDTDEGLVDVTGAPIPPYVVAAAHSDPRSQAAEVVLGLRPLSKLEG